MIFFSVRRNQTIRKLKKIILIQFQLLDHCGERRGSNQENLIQKKETEFIFLSVENQRFAKKNFRL